MRQIIYTSRAVTIPSASELEALLKQSRAANRVRCVTGLLTYHEGHYFQILEGPSEGVWETYLKLLADPRHCDILDIVDSPTETREFGDWSMGLLDWDQFSAQGPSELRHLGNVQNTSSASTRAGLVLSLFAKGQWHRHVTA